MRPLTSNFADQETQRRLSRQCCHSMPQRDPARRDRKLPSRPVKPNASRANIPPINVPITSFGGPDRFERLQRARNCQSYILKNQASRPCHDGNHGRHPKSTPTERQIGADRQAGSALGHGEYHAGRQGGGQQRTPGKVLLVLPARDFLEHKRHTGKRAAKGRRKSRRRACADRIRARRSGLRRTSFQSCSRWLHRCGSWAPRGPGLIPTQSKARLPEILPRSDARRTRSAPR